MSLLCAQVGSSSATLELGLKRRCSFGVFTLSHLETFAGRPDLSCDRSDPRLVLNESFRNQFAGRSDLSCDRSDPRRVLNSKCSLV